MARCIALDVGGKRTGIAVSNVDMTIAFPLATIPTQNLLPYLKTYFSKEIVNKILVGYPLDLNNKITHGTKIVEQIIVSLQKEFPTMKIITIDEKFSSKIAQYFISQMGLKKSVRRDKSLIDKTAATLLLQDYINFQ
ncbi:MAG: Holliday junction resolvase RuvX [Sediminibacterium sp.]|nr:Holliday junction resolvase RuvX [Sediminibacterium sp.]